MMLLKYNFFSGLHFYPISQTHIACRIMQLKMFMVETNLLNNACLLLNMLDLDIFYRPASQDNRGSVVNRIMLPETDIYFHSNMLCSVYRSILQFCEAQSKSLEYTVNSAEVESVGTEDIAST